MLVGLGAALLAALSFGVAGPAQAIAARRHGLVSLLMGAVGLVYLLGWVLHLVAIARLPLYLAQVGIALSLVVTALIASRLMGEPLTGRHWVAVVGMVLGLALLVLSSGAVGDHDLGTFSTLMLYLGLLVLLLLGRMASRARTERSGILLGLLAGVSYGGSAIATRSLVDPTWDSGTVAPALTIGLFGLLGFWLYTLGLQAASVTATTAPLVLGETLVPSVFGLVVLGDGVRAGWSAVALVGFGLSIAAALVLSGAEAGLDRLGPRRDDPLGDPQPS